MNEPQRRTASQGQDPKRVARKIDGVHAERRLTRMKEPIHKGKELLPLSVIHSAAAGDAGTVERILKY